MSVDDLQRYESEVELDLYRQYRDVVGMFRHVVETERRFYLANDVDVQIRSTDGGEVFFEVHLRDVVVRFDYAGKPVESLQLAYRFHRDVYRGYQPPKELANR